MFYVDDSQLRRRFERLSLRGKQVSSVGQNHFFAKTDVKNAVRLILIRPEDYYLLGIYWQGLYYYDGLFKQVPVELFRCFQLLLNGMPRTSYIFLIFCIC